MKKITLQPIGIIHTPYKKLEDIPCQANRSNKIGRVEVFKKFEEGLKDIEGFSHLELIYFFHQSKKYSLLAKPFLDKKLHGIFAIRGPRRPNFIGSSVVKLIKREGNILTVQQIDMLDGTPLLDIKPYIPEFIKRRNVRIGWLKNKL